MRSEDSATTRLRALFDLAVELQPSERGAFLDRETDGDPGLRHELEELLHHHDALGDFLATGPPRRAADAWLAPGDRIGEHEIVAMLGHGGSGQVYRARQLALGRDVALKVVRAADIRSRDRERFLRGARIAAGIHHPNLVEVHDCGEDRARGVLYYSMRLVEGRTLQEVLERLEGNPPDAAVRRTLVRRIHEVAEALGALHARDVIHQDVKPGNILLEGGAPDDPWNGSAVLVDFGLLRDLGASPRHSTVWATVPYAAPEVLLLGRVDARADVYALGLCLYDLVSGSSAAHRDERGVETPRLARVAPDVEPDLEAIVHRAIDPSSDRRYRDAVAMEFDLRAFLNEEPVQARRLTGVERARRWVRRHPDRVLRWSLRGGLVLVGVLFLALGVGALARTLDDAWSARSSWERGDLPAARASATLLPAWSRSVALDPVLHRALESTDDESLAGVLREDERRGPRAATLLAARLLERDGHAAHPDLARFLLHELRDTGPGDGPDAALKLANRLFLERPAEAPEDGFVRAVREFMESLTQAPEASAEDRLLALSTLAGCGNHRSVEVIVSALEARSAEPGPRERAVIATTALEGIARRSRACGYRPELAALDWTALVLRMDAVPRDEADSRSVGLGQLAAIASFCRREEGLPLPSLAPFEATGLDTILLLAVHRDRRFPDRLTKEFLDPDVLSAATWLHHFETLGTLLAVYGDPGLYEEVHQEVSTWRPVSPRELRYLDALARNFACGANELGQWDEGLFDRESHLGEWIARRRLPWVEPELLETLRPGTPLALAQWWFGDPPACFGSAAGLRTRACRLVANGDADDSFLCLDTFGVSEVSFLVRIDADMPDSPRLRLECQKGGRRMLPGAGLAVVEIECQGKVAVRPVASTSAILLDESLSLWERYTSDVLEIRVRLTEDSTTTLRIYRAEILGPNEEQPR